MIHEFLHNLQLIKCYDKVAKAKCAENDPLSEHFKLNRLHRTNSNMNLFCFIFL